MSDFNLKDIPQLTETNTLDGTAKLAIAVPTGVGSNHNLRYIQKGILARFDGSAVPTRMPFSGASRVMNFNGFSDSWLEYFTPSQALYLRGQILGVSPDGSTIPARLESNGSVVGSNIKVTNGGNTYDVTFDGGSDETASFSEGGSIQVNPKTTAITPTTGATVNVVAAQWRVVYFELVGTIAALTINMPATPTEGQRVTLYFKEAVTSITHGAGGENLEGALTRAEAGQGATWVFQESASTWVPIGRNVQTPETFTFTPLTGDTIAIPGRRESIAFVNPAGTIAALTVDFPPGIVDGQKVILYFGAAVTALTLTPTGGATFQSAISSAGANARIQYAWIESLNLWIAIT